MSEDAEAPLLPLKEGPSARVLILAPTANDARLTTDFLHRAGFETHVCRDVFELRERTDEACGCIVVAEETLRAESIGILAEALAHQPSWSDVPVILIASGGGPSVERLRRLARLGPGGNVSILERPFHPDTLISVTAVALKARARQYQVRDLLTALGTARDVAEQASRAKDDFLAALSHELRTPLNPVLLLAAAGAENPTYSEKVREDFAVIRKNVNLEARLIDDLLDLTRITRGKLQLQMVRCDLHEILKDAITNVQGDANEKNILLVKEFQTSRVQVKGDPVRLQQVFWNILKNAVKFAPPGSEVQITTADGEGSNVLVVIRDYGIGMSENELEHIFNAFAQGNHSTENSRYGGLGLGLSISRMLMDLHFGTIRAASPGPGLGSTFTVEIPGTKATLSLSPLVSGTEEPSLAIVPPPTKDRRRILLVEDHVDTLAILSLLLSGHYEVVTAASATEARAQAAVGMFDFVVSDIGLPDEAGYDLMAFLHQEYGLNGIALTGYGMEEDVARSQQSGFIDHLTKPVEFSALERSLRNAFPPERVTLISSKPSGR